MLTLCHTDISSSHNSAKTHPLHPLHVRALSNIVRKKDGTTRPGKKTDDPDLQLLESGITSQPNPSAPSRVPPSQQHQLQPQHSWQGWWRSDNWHNWSSWSQEKWRQWQDSSHQFESDTGMFVSSLLLSFSSEQPETACISDVARFLFVRKKVPTSIWPMVPWNSALLTAHSWATRAPGGTGTPGIRSPAALDTRGCRASPSIWVRRYRLQLRAARQTLTP